MTITYGVHSEVGKLRRVLVDRPGAALARLTPSNCHELLFDDVIWVKQARVEHMTFVDAIRHRGTEVVFLREVLAETLRSVASAERNASTSSAPMSAGWRLPLNRMKRLAHCR